MSSPPAVSVLMTAFNRELYVGPAIESVLAQTLGDFELVVVDDGSGDRTVDIARSYEADPRVRVIVNERNLGDYPNRNRAAALARGRFIKYHDSDDVMYAHCLETMVGALDTMPEAGFGLSVDSASSGGHDSPDGPCPPLLTRTRCPRQKTPGLPGLHRHSRRRSFRRQGNFRHRTIRAA